MKSLYIIRITNRIKFESLNETKKILNGELTKYFNVRVIPDADDEELVRSYALKELMNQFYSGESCYMSFRSAFIKADAKYQTSTKAGKTWFIQQKLDEMFKDFCRHSLLDKKSIIQIVNEAQSACKTSYDANMNENLAFACGLGYGAQVFKELMEKQDFYKAFLVMPI